MSDRNAHTACIGLVDDDELVRFATKALLTCHDFQVQDFGSAESLLELDSLEQLDCLIIDFRMDGLSGLQLLQQVQSRAPGVPAIVASGFLSEADELALREAGASAIMDKPINSSELIAELVRLTGACS